MEPMKTITPNKIKTVEEFVRGYQSSLRALRDQVPEARALPGPIRAAIGRCEVWPCRDAAVVLTYADNQPLLNIELMDPVEMTVNQFMHEHDAFRYFDSRGSVVPFRLGIAPIEEGDPAYDSRIPKNDFSTRTIESSDIVALERTEKSELVQVFRPAFTKLSIYGWNTILRNPQRAAIKEVRKTLVSKNMLGDAAWDFNGPQRMQQLIASTDLRVSQLEACLDSKDFAGTRSILGEHPELIHPAFVISHSNVRLGNDDTADFILMVQTDDKVEYIVLKLEDISGTYFNDSKAVTPIKSYEILSRLKESFEHNRNSLPFAISADAVVRFELVLGRGSSLTYLQREALRSKENDLDFLTYDDLIGRVRYETYDVANVWDRFESVEEQLKKFGISSEKDFVEVMGQIDDLMRKEGTAITARSFQGPGKFTWAYRTWLMHRDPLHSKIVEWFNGRYGDRLKMDPTWKMAVLIRGDLYQLLLPLVFGSVNVICSAEQFGVTNESRVPKRNQRPTINVLGLLDDFTEDYARSLTKDELSPLMNAFLLGFNARNEIDSISESEFVKEAIGDIQVSVAHLFATPPQYGLSKWSSLQAAEKLLKAFIRQKGGKLELIHNLEKLAAAAESLGLPPIPRALLKAIQCPAGVRYGDPEVTLVEAVEAHHAALAICSGIANYKFLTRYYKQATELVPGKFYTNSLGKQYRCVKVKGDKANIILFDELLGKPLEIEFVQDRKFWGQYFLIEDEGTIQTLEVRYQALKSAPPLKASGEGRL